MGPFFDDDVSQCEPAIKKRAHREAILSQYPNWRPIIPKDPPLDVSQLIISRLTPEEHRIVHLDATALVERIAAHQLTAVQVFLAFAKTAVAAQDLTNCLSEIFIEEGLVRAKELDAHLAATGKVVGPLHGLPVSIKDHILVKGHDTSSGYVAWAGKTVADRDAVFVDILRKSGAVLYVKTANPQTLLVSLSLGNGGPRIIMMHFDHDHSPWRRRITYMAALYTHSIDVFPLEAALGAKER